MIGYPVGLDICFSTNFSWQYISKNIGLLGRKSQHSKGGWVQYFGKPEKAYHKLCQKDLRAVVTALHKHKKEMEETLFSSSTRKIDSMVAN